MADDKQPAAQPVARMKRHEFERLKAMPPDCQAEYWLQSSPEPNDVALYTHPHDPAEVMRLREQVRELAEAVRDEAEAKRARGDRVVAAAAEIERLRALLREARRLIDDGYGSQMYGDPYIADVKTRIDAELAKAQPDKPLDSGDWPLPEAR